MRRILACLFAFAASALLRAADAPQEQPIPVTKEPFHHPVFENDAIRIIDVQIPPGATCKYHQHVIPSVVVYLTKSTNKSQTWGETDPKKFLDRTLNPGESRYAPYDTQPLTHRVTNTGTGLFRVFDIELLHAKPANPPAFAPLPPPAVPQWEEKLARLSKVQLEPGASCTITATAQSHLVVGIHGAVELVDAHTSPLQNADYRFVPAQKPVVLANHGKEKAEALLLDLN